MNPRPKLTTEERERLTAFLDGESDEKDSQAVEAQMTERPEVRKEAEALQRAWEMLDFLPRPAIDESFSTQTMARLEVEKSRAVTRLRRRRRLGWSVWGIAIAAAAALGFIVFYQPLPSSEEVRIVANQELYQNVDDWEFLQELAAADLFGEEFEP